MKQLSKLQKKVLISLVKKCEVVTCKNKENLEIHRIKRGNVGGEYLPHNIKIFCQTCHKKIHSNETN